MAMASLSSFLASILLVFLFITPSFSRLSNTVNETADDKSVVNKVCSKAKNPSMCLQILPHDGTLQVLAKSAVSSGYDYAQDTIVNVIDAANNGTDRKLKKKYSSCLTNMNTASAAVAKAKKQVRSGVFCGLGSAAETAKAEADKCIYLFKGQPTDPFYILREIKSFEDIYIDIIRIISTMLKNVQTYISSKDSQQIQFTSYGR
ncbi:pectinmethylesterase inhibitor [Tripterygium wilfordii]|uniref:Pectinmethylesterase inhibitor n=1 Tax=Tripterygium wilfordii TaxID=458696 RepID=A0A7J7CT85_TRIWF|nr:pectinesterase inhibitor-like [Tripterygium wilfordii]KAF5737096.1 pectinmethylesterase inhibitor [Tripterygium wilfordii]